MTSFSKRLSDNWQDAVALILGVVLIASPWIMGFAGVSVAMWNAVLLGALIVLMAVMAIVNFHEWEEWADIAIGLWLVVSPWALGFATAYEVGPTGAATWTFVVLGALTLAMAAWSLMAHRQHMVA